ncbi:MAG: SurA N-terminal domain-containing protein [Pseudomonadales bacterium]
MSIMSMRENSQGLATKVIIGLIIIAFAFFGLGSITTFITPVPRVASVNGSDITTQEMEVAVERNRRMLIGQGTAADSIDEDALRANVLDSLITRALLSQSLETLGLSVSEKRLDQALIETEVFQVDGKFDSNQYRLVLASAGYDPVTYREELRKDEALGQLAEAIQVSAFMTDAQANRTASLSRQTRDVAYLLFSASALTEAVELSPNAADDYYERNRAQFFTEETLDIEYVELSRVELMAAVDAPLEALKRYYEETQDLYTKAERRRVSHILISAVDGEDPSLAQERMQKIQSRLDSGEDFSALAQELSEDPGSAGNGGDLGFVEAGIFVPTFEAAAFELTQTGEVSEPIETQFGLHLIKLTELTEAETSAFSEVAEEVEKAFREDQTKESYIARISELDEMAFEDPNLTGIAQQMGLEVKALTSQSRASETGILSNGKVRDAVFSPDLMIDGNNSAVIEINDDIAVVVRVANYQESVLKPFEAVNDEILELLAQQEAEAIARKKAEEALAMLEAGDITRYVADQFGLSWTVVSQMSRYQNDTPKALRDSAFSLPKPSALGKSLGLAQLDGGDVAVVSVTNVSNPADATVSSQTQGLAQFLESQQGSLEFQWYQDSLRALGDVEG